MTLPIARYPLDPTGLNPDNAISGEIHTLNIRQVRAIAPTYGPFFIESLALYDNATNRLLIKGIDFQCVELLQEATLRYGKEIAELILILDQTVSNEVRVSYQVLGGLYQNNASGIMQMYETAMLDNRPVDWVNVLNKPYEYTPTLHRHLLEDVYGFEYIVVALERIRNAIMLSDVPAFEALITWVKARSLDTVTFSDIDNVNSVEKYVTFDKLLYALDKLNFNGITLTTAALNVVNNSSVLFKLVATNLPDNSQLFWTIDHISSTDDDFNLLSGIINISGNRGHFNVSIANSAVVEGPEKFRVIVRKNSITGPILAKTEIVTISSFSPDGGSVGGVALTFMDYINACCLYNPTIDVNPMSMFLIEEE